MAHHGALHPAQPSQRKAGSGGDNGGSGGAGSNRLHQQADVPTKAHPMSEDAQRGLTPGNDNSPPGGKPMGTRNDGGNDNGSGPARAGGGRDSTAQGRFGPSAGDSPPLILSAGSGKCNEKRQSPGNLKSVDGVQSQPVGGAPKGGKEEPAGGKGQRTEAPAPTSLAGAGAQVSGGAGGDLSCVPCEKVFTSEIARAAHLQSHVRCPEAGCDFSALKKVVNTHREVAHGQFSGSGFQVRKWRAECAAGAAGGGGVAVKALPP